MNNNCKIFNRKLKRKSQLTLSIMAGFLILIIIVAVFYIREYVVRERIAIGQLAAEEFEKDTNAIKNYVEKCVRDTGYNGLALLGEQGGYIEIPKPVRYRDRALLYLDNINIQPSLNQTKKWLIEYIDNNIKKCSNLDVFREKGFEIIEGDLKSWVDYEDTTVRLDVEYPITIRKLDNERKIERFNLEYDIRYRRVFELASQIINKILSPEFRFSKPLELVNASDFKISYEAIDDDALIFTITDPYAYEAGVYYKFTFATKFGRSDLVRRVYLQEKSSQVGVDLPFVIYSPDRMAQLMLLGDTLIHLNGSDVNNITVDQHYPNNVIREHVVFHETASDAFVYENLTYVTTNPIYQFEPTGLKFSYPQRLLIYWNEEENPHGDEEVGIIYDEGEGWRPLQVEVNYNESYAYTDIPGFSYYSLVNCEDQELKTKSATAKVDPGSGCWVKTIIMVVIVIIIVTLVILSFGAATSLTSGSSVAMSSEASMTVTATTETTLTVTEGTIAATGTGVTATPTAFGTMINIPAGTTATLSTGAVAGGATFSVSSGTAVMGAATAGSVAGLSTGLGALGASLASAASAAINAITFGLAGAGFWGSGVLLVGLGMKLAVLGGAIVGGMYLSAEMSDRGDKDTVTFTPTCDQDVVITKSGNGKGTCMPFVGQREVTAGQPVSVTAVIKECPDGKKYACGKCKLTCTVKYK